MNLDELFETARHGVPEAQYTLSLCFMNGWGVDQDNSIAEEWLLKASMQGHAASQYELSRLLQAVSENPVAEAIEWLQKSATQGFAPAEFLYSIYCEDGIGLPANLSSAFKFCLSAAERGYCPAAKKVARMFEDGLGVAKSPDKAFFWYKLAAEQGDADSASSVGRMYAHGIGVEKNDALAMQWYEEGQKRGSPWAYYALSSIYRFGELNQAVDSNRAEELALEAEELLKRWAEHGRMAGNYQIVQGRLQPNVQF